MKRIYLIIALLALAIGANAARIDTLAIRSQYLDQPENVLVIVPEKGIVKRSCPSLYLLNGFGGDHTAWMAVRPNLPELADKYGMFIIMPDGRDSWYWDSPEKPGLQMESFITKTLVPYIDQNYTTIPAAEQRAITGLSMGGQGAMFLALRHPDIWKNVGSTSGGVDIRPFPDRWKMKESLGDQASNRKRWEAHSPINLIDIIAPGQLNIIFDCGVDDFFFNVNNDFHSKLLDRKIPHDYIVRPGAHNRDYWNNSILYQLLYFNEQFNKTAKEK